MRWDLGLGRPTTVEIGRREFVWRWIDFDSNPSSSQASFLFVPVFGFCGVEGKSAEWNLNSVQLSRC